LRVSSAKLVDIQLEPDDLVAKRAGDLGDCLGSSRELIGDEHPQPAVLTLSHAGASSRRAVSAQQKGGRGSLDRSWARSNRSLSTPVRAHAK
jgi:hypothetical protein